MSVKIMQLNALHGALYRPMAELIAVEDPDILCMQEVSTNPNRRMSAYFDLKERIQQRFPGYTHIHHFRHYTFMANGDECAEGILIASRIPLRDYQTIEHCTGYRFNKDPKAIDAQLVYATQFVRVLADTPFLLINHYGYIDGDNSADKRGTAETDRHAQNILTHAAQLGDERVVMCGDFNVLPTSSTVQLITQQWRDNASKHGITTTRPPNCLPIGPHICDYIFTSPSVTVKNFRVADASHEICSDHLALFAEIE